METLKCSSPAEPASNAMLPASAMVQPTVATTGALQRVASLGAMIPAPNTTNTVTAKK